jgi:tRNA-Thr(GGU) m(6)t(6)A37 methyltransferase TsaA
LKTITVELKIIGEIHSPYKLSSDITKQFRKNISEIEIFDEYSKGLMDIEGFSHIYVFYWMHKSKGFSLQVKTPWDNRLHGLFSTRSPHRPNPIANTIVKLIAKKKNILRVQGLDAVDGSPLLDIKPYVEKFDIQDKVSSGWLEKQI